MLENNQKEIILLKDLGYYKDNCRWATNEIQTQNIRKVKSNNTSGYKGVGFYIKKINGFLI